MIASACPDAIRKRMMVPVDAAYLYTTCVLIISVC
jgi:hypothetical protein